MKRVLIADDSEIMRRIICSFLQEREDIEICAQTSNGPETIVAALALRPDLLVLDVVMPGLNGIEVAAVLKKDLPLAKTVLFTMYGDSVGKRIASAVGVNIVLAKPEGLSQLAKVIHSLLDDSTETVRKQGTY